MVNSNSIAASVLSKMGINAEDVFPASPVGGYPGADTILSGAGSDELQAFGGSDYIFDRGGGDDTFYGGDDTELFLFDTDDGLDTVQYDGIEVVTLEVSGDPESYDAARIAFDGEGGTDTLYSIEKVRMVHFDQEHTLDYSDFEREITIESYNLSERFFENGDLLEHGGSFKTGVNVLEVAPWVYSAGDEVFKAVNFGTFIATDYDDKVTLRGLGILESVSVSTGAGDDVVDITVQNSLIDLGSGADTVKNAGSGSIIYTGAGDNAQDTLRLGDDIYYADAGFEDRFKSFGFTLDGAGRYAYSESPWTSGLFLKYSRNVDGDLVIRDMLGRDTYVANYVNTLDGAAGNTAGIFIYNWDVGVYRLYEYAGKNPPPSIMNNFKALDAQLKAGLGDKFTGTVDPLAIDLDGDGLEVRPETYVTSPHFDMNGDGFAERVGWVGPPRAFAADAAGAN